MILLNGIELNDEILWEDRDQSTQVAQTIERTLGGKPIITHGRLLKGRPITLRATQEQGWLKKNTVDALIDLANTPGGVYQLQISVRFMDDEFYTVMFRNHEPPAVDFEPLVPRQDQQPGEYMFGSIKLIEVN